MPHKLKSRIALLILTLCGAFFYTMPAFAEGEGVQIAPQHDAQCATILTNYCNGSADDIVNIIKFVIGTLTIGIAVLGTIGIIWCGFLIMSARDNEQQIAKAKRRILEIIIGLVAWILGSFIIQLMLPTFTGTVEDPEVNMPESSNPSNPNGSNNHNSSSSNNDSNVTTSTITGTAKYQVSLDSKPFKIDAKTSKKAKLKYKSSNKRVAVVTEKGKVYPNDVGTAVIQVSSGKSKFNVKIRISKRTTKPHFIEVPAGSVVKSNYYVDNASYSHWDHIFRYKDPIKALDASKAARATLANKNVVGHPPDVGNYSFTRALIASNVNWNPSKIHHRVGTACSQFVLTMAQIAGIHKDAKHVNSGWANKDAPGTVRTLVKDSNFYTITESSYVNSYKKLKPGDILVDSDRSDGGAHAVMIVD